MTDTMNHGISGRYTKKWNEIILELIMFFKEIPW
jgi:hypothetical protein